MKLLHIADLHIGKKLHDISLIDSGGQPDWLEKLLELVRTEKPEVILIAGDIYDRSNPPREAVDFVGHMLSELSGMDWEPYVLMIAGNHDSGPMVEYLGDVVARQRIIVAGTVEPEIRHITLSDAYGPVTFWLIPYVFPAEINRVLGTDYRDYDTAFRAYLEAQKIDVHMRNVILSHQNITAFGNEAERGGSETMVGGVGGIDYTAFDGFEYVALGHIHAAQAMGRREVRYAGSPLCYHFDELRHAKKGPVLIDLGPKGTAPEIRSSELTPLHPLREVAGTMSEILDAETYGSKSGEYIRVVLKPEPDGLKAGTETGTEGDRLRALFAAHGSQVLDIFYDYHTQHSTGAEWTGEGTAELPVEERFAAFWAERRETEPDAASMELLRFIAEQDRNTQSEDGEPTEAEVDAILAFAMEQEGGTV